MAFVYFGECMDTHGWRRKRKKKLESQFIPLFLDVPYLHYLLEPVVMLSVLS